MLGNPTSALTLEVAIPFTGVSYCGIHHKKAGARLVSQRYHHKTVTGNPASHSSLTKSRAASEFPSRFLNMKQHRGHKMINNCDKNIIDWFET